MGLMKPILGKSGLVNDWSATGHERVATVCFALANADSAAKERWQNQGAIGIAT